MIIFAIANKEVSKLCLPLVVEGWHLNIIFLYQISLFYHSPSRTFDLIVKAAILLEMTFS